MPEDVVAADVPEPANIFLPREREAEPPADSRFPDILLPLHLLHVQRWVPGVLYEEVECFVGQAFENVVEGVVLLNERRGVAEIHSLFLHDLAGP